MIFDGGATYVHVASSKKFRHETAQAPDVSFTRLLVVYSLGYA